MATKPSVKTTLFISSFHPFISRNILATPLLSMLAERGVRVVLLVPRKKQAYFEEEFGASGAVIEAVETTAGKRDRFLNYLSLSALHTRSLSIKRQTEMRGSGSILTRFIANPMGRWIVRALHPILTPTGTFASLFGKYEPAAVFATDMNNAFDLRLIRDARARDVPVVGMVRSWDNLTSKGLLRTVPDILVVNNETERDEALRLHGVPVSRIRVVGIPHYDRYVTGVRTPRKDFFARFGVPEEKRLVLYAPTGDRYLSDNTIDRQIVLMLDALLPPDCHLLVRLPPTDVVGSLEGFAGKRVSIERPSTRFGTFKNIELAPGDDDHLADTLTWSDLVIAGPSTLAVDAAFFDKPVILIGFDGEEPRPYLASVRRYYDYDHWQPVLASGGVRLVESETALKEAFEAYLLNPKLDADGRARMVVAEAYRPDGKATERLAGVISEAVGL